MERTIENIVTTSLSFIAIIILSRIIGICSGIDKIKSKENNKANKINPFVSPMILCIH